MKTLNHYMQAEMKMIMKKYRDFKKNIKRYISYKLSWAQIPHALEEFGYLSKREAWWKHPLPQDDTEVNKCIKSP